MEKIKQILRDYHEPVWDLIRLAIFTIVFLFILKSVYFPYEGLLFPNSDFEMGNLTNWQTEGTAFNAQPIYGDVPYYLNRGASHYIGNYWVNTNYSRQAPYDPVRSIQGEGPTGKLRSISFKIKRDKITFLLGGGNYSDDECVFLVVHGQKALKERARGILINGELMGRVTWDVSAWKGQDAFIQIEDNLSGPWGHVSVDDFRYKGLFL